MTVGEKYDTRGRREALGRKHTWTKAWRFKIHGKFSGKHGFILIENNIPGRRRDLRDKQDSIKQNLILGKY